MANDYDKIFKENIGQFFLALSEKYLGIQISSTEELKDKLQTTLEKEADFLRKVKTPKGEEFILHLEFQSHDDKAMIYRMQEYFAILQKKYQIPVRQFVIYIGEQAPKMRTKLDKDEIFKSFELMNLQSISAEELILSDIPEEIILAVLSNFQNQNPLEILGKIISRLQKLSHSDIALKKYVRQLTVLSRLRNLVNQTQKKLRDMAITYDIEKDQFYIEGKKEGKKEGRKEGEKEMILKMLQAGKLSLEDIADISGLSLEELKKLNKR